MAGDEAKPADEAPDDAEAPPQPAQPQTQSLYPKFMYDSRDTPEGEQEKTLPPDELRRLALPRVLGGGVRRVAGETYPNALLTDGWPSDGLLLARSAVAERILVDRYGADRGAVGRDHPQWWPARAISIEEYLEYYATTLAKHRPKFDHVAVVFLRPWWSEHLADDGVARMFELEPAPAKATHVRPLAGSDPAPPSTPAPAADVAAGRFRDALRIAGALSGYAASHLGASSEPRDGPRDAEGWERRRARLAEAYGNSSASPRDKKRDPPRDVSTAHVDVVNYPSVVLTLPWYEIVTKTPGDLVLADLPRSLVGADLDAGRPRGLGRSSISPLDGPPEKRPVAAEFGNMGRERSNSVRSIGSPRNSLGGGSPSPSASAAKKGVASPPKAPREPPTARERADVAALLGARSGPGDFDERAFRDAVRRDGAPAEAEALPPSVFRPASPTLEALPAADVTEEDSEARSSKASSESPPASPKDNPEVARAAESKDGGEEDSGGEAPMERDDDDAARRRRRLAMGDAGWRQRRGGGRRGGGGGGGGARGHGRGEAAAEDDDDEEAAEAPPPATAAGGPRCDKCDGAHETADCPYFKKEREPSPVQNMKPVQPLSSAGLLKRRASDRSLSGQMPPASPRERPRRASRAARGRARQQGRRGAPRRARGAATAHNDAELILTKVVAAQAAGVGGSPTRDRVAAAEARVASASRQLEHARSGRRDLASLRRSWFAAKGVIQGRVVGGVARPAARGLPARKKLRSRSDEEATEAPEADREDADADLPAYEWAGARRPRTLAIYDRRCRLHETKVYCMEQSRRAVAAAAVVEAAALRHPTRLWVERSVHEGYLGRATALLSYAHSRVYVSAVRRRCLDLKTNATMLFGGEDEDTCGNRHTWDASLAASAAVLQAVDAVVSGEAKNALCAVRPPGHHAGASVNALGAESNGYCILNHAALGAKYAAHERGLQRVAVFDFDVHHGNGTEDVLARTCDPRFMYLSLHACGRDVYPGSGKREVPDHPGVLNLPHAYEEPMTAEWCHAYAMPKVLKALDGFRPDLLILSSGFDAHKRDPVDLGRFDASDYGDLTRACVDWARRNCCGRVVSVLEGGYGVDCGPAGEYVQSGRREAFDTCLRAHVDELIADDAADTADDPEPANPQTARVSAPHLEAAAADRRGKAAAFFQEPPPDQSRLGAAAGPAGPQALTAAALARLGDVKPGVKLPDVSDGSV
ncbi:Wnt/PCP co-receptor [Aureococcus anophagefferens]|uniref:histone deacetylase n=1 Tax=Aureococcus anophagefferens TaxID=44056 RepID=A0ABR1GBJ3_AURAN